MHSLQHLVIWQRFGFLVHFYGILRTEMEDCIVAWQVSLKIQETAAPTSLSRFTGTTATTTKVFRSMKQRLSTPPLGLGGYEWYSPSRYPNEIMCQECNVTDTLMIVSPAASQLSPWSLQRRFSREPPRELFPTEII